MSSAALVLGSVHYFQTMIVEITFQFSGFNTRVLQHYQPHKICLQIKGFMPKIAALNEFKYAFLLNQYVTQLSDYQASIPG